MSYQVALAIASRLEADGRLADTERGLYSLWDGMSDDTQQLDLAVETRPPFDSVTVPSTH
jgi:hypothetical protein